jgi:hypothetical protein
VVPAENQPVAFEEALASWRQAECLPPYFFQTRMRVQISFCF